MDWEFSFLYFLQNIHMPWLDKLMVAITSLGDGGKIWIGIAVLMLFVKKYRRCGIEMIVGLLFVELLGNQLLKQLVGRERPCVIDTGVTLLIHAPGGYSFPSGHTFSGFTAATAILVNHKKAGIVAMVLATLIAFSRMYLFVHFPTDILCGMVLGIVLAALVHKGLYVDL